MRPDLLLFDEPTSALDPELVGEVLLVMRESLAREGPDHGDRNARKWHSRARAATRILFLDRGRVIESAAPDRFFFRAPPKTERARQFVQRYAGDTAGQQWQRLGKRT